MAEQERQRRADMDFKEGQAAYDARVDKKFCPQCGNKQSFAEVKEKKARCPVCQVDYAAKTTWAKVSFKGTDDQHHHSSAPCPSPLASLPPPLSSLPHFPLLDPPPQPLPT